MPTASLSIDPEVFTESFNVQPFGFTHDLSAMRIFQFDFLKELASRYGDNRQDFFVAAGAQAPGSVFRDVPELIDKPSAALDHLEINRCRILLKRPENYDPGFKDLLLGLVDQVNHLRGKRGETDRILRLESAILISSAKTTTPFHFDPEIGFFSQIEGSKEYHVYRPDVVSEDELERFYRNNAVDIAQVSLDDRDPSRENVFMLTAGHGFHQPQNAPHWVQTGEGRSVSYTFVFDTQSTRARGRARAFNYYERKIGLSPASPGHKPMVDSVKAQTMELALPLRKLVGRGLQYASLR